MKIRSFVTGSQVGYIIETEKDLFLVSIREDSYGYGIVPLLSNAMLTELTQTSELTAKSVHVKWDKSSQNYFLVDEKTDDIIAKFCRTGKTLKESDLCSTDGLDIPSSLSISFTLPSTGEVFTNTVSYVTPFQKWKQLNKGPFMKVWIQCEFPRYPWAYPVTDVRLSNPPSMDIVIPLGNVDDLVQFALKNNIKISPYMKTLPENFLWPIPSETNVTSTYNICVTKI